MQTRIINYRAYIAYGIVCLAWGSTYLAIRIGVQEMPPLLFGGIRFTIAGLIMLAYVLSTGKKMPGSWQDLKTIIIIGICLLVAANGLILWAEQYVPSGLTSLIVCATPLMVAIMDYLVPGGKRLGARGWFGLIIGFAGMVLLISPNSGMPSIYAPALAALIMACIFWSGGSIYASRKPIQASMFAVAALETLLAGIVLSFLGMVNGELELFHWSWNGIYAVGFLVLVGSIMGYTAFIYIVESMPPSIGMTYSYVNPIVAVILGGLVLGEAVTKGEIVSFAVILAGVILTHSARFAAPDQNKGLEAESAFNRLTSGLNPGDKNDGLVLGEENEL